jgi:hypothetical protein
LGAVVTLLLLAYLALRPDADQAGAEQYAVYSAYIESGLTGDSHDLGNRGGLVVIDERTVFPNRFAGESTLNQFRFLLGHASRVTSAIPSLPRSLLFEFFLADLRDERLERRLHLPVNYELATEPETNLYPSEEFMRRFPQNYGYLTFSRVAFNRDLTEAFFYTEHICGLCGAGRYVLMMKVNGNWVVGGTASTWIS